MLSMILYGDPRKPDSWEKLRVTQIVGTHYLENKASILYQLLLESKQDDNPLYMLHSGDVSLNILKSNLFPFHPDEPKGIGKKSITKKLHGSRFTKRNGVIRVKEYDSLPALDSLDAYCDSEPEEETIVLHKKPKLNLPAVYETENICSANDKLSCRSPLKLFKIGAFPKGAVMINCLVSVEGRENYENMLFPFINWYDEKSMIEKIDDRYLGCRHSLEHHTGNLEGYIEGKDKHEVILINNDNVDSLSIGVVSVRNWIPGSLNVSRFVPQENENHIWINYTNEDINEIIMKRVSELREVTNADILKKIHQNI